MKSFCRVCLGLFLVLVVLFVLVPVTAGDVAIYDAGTSPAITEAPIPPPLPPAPPPPKPPQVLAS